MNLREYQRTQVEIATLDKMLQETPQELAIERHGFESRKRELESLLAMQAAPNRDPARILLTFRGKPVLGTEGIFADFGAQAVNAFTDAISTIGASLEGPLGKRGAIPEKDRYRLLVTGTALGSFGFQLEEAPSLGHTLFETNDVVGTAIEQTEQLIRATMGTDDELTDAVSEVEPRALESLRKFLDLVASQEAVFSLGFRERAVRYKDVAQLKSSIDRIRQGNIHEKEETLVGRFQGVIPKRRDFQFSPDNTQETIIGKVGNEIEEPAEINKHLGNRVKAIVVKKTVGLGKPRYRLLSFESLGQN